MISYYFQSNHLFLFVIKTLEYLPKWPLTDYTFYLVSISNRVSNWYFSVTLIICKLFYWRYSSLSWKVNLIFLYLLKLEICHIWVFVSFLTKKMFINYGFKILYSLILHGFEFMFLKVWRFFFLFGKAWMIFFNLRHFSFCLFYIKGMSIVLNLMINHFKRLRIEGHKNKFFIYLRIDL